MRKKETKLQLRPTHICGHEAEGYGALHLDDPCDTCWSWSDGYRASREFRKWKGILKLQDFDANWGTPKMLGLAEARRAMEASEALDKWPHYDISDLGWSNLRQKAWRAFRSSERLSSPLWWIQNDRRWCQSGLVVLAEILETDKGCFMIFALDCATSDNNLVDVYLKHLYSHHDLTRMELRRGRQGRAGG